MRLVTSDKEPATYSVFLHVFVFYNKTLTVNDFLHGDHVLLCHTLFQNCSPSQSEVKTNKSTLSHTKTKFYISIINMNSETEICIYAIHILHNSVLEYDQPHSTY